MKNSNDLEMIQKVALKVIVKENVINKKNAQNKLELESLSNRREQHWSVSEQKILLKNSAYGRH